MENPNKKINKFDLIATRQMEEIWDEHHDPKKNIKRFLEKKRKENIEQKKKDYGVE